MDNIEMWEHAQAIVAMSQAEKHKQRFIRDLLWRHRFEVLRLAIVNGAVIPPELLRQDNHPPPGGQTPDATG